AEGIGPVKPQQPVLPAPPPAAKGRMLVLPPTRLPVNRTGVGGDKNVCPARLIFSLSTSVTAGRRPAAGSAPWTIHTSGSTTPWLCGTPPEVPLTGGITAWLLPLFVA